MIAVVYQPLILAAYAALNMIVLSARRGSERENNQCGHAVADFDFHYHFACCCRDTNPHHLSALQAARDKTTAKQTRQGTIFIETMFIEVRWSH